VIPSLVGLTNQSSEIQGFSRRHSTEKVKKSRPTRRIFPPCRGRGTFPDFVAGEEPFSSLRGGFVEGEEPFGPESGLSLVKSESVAEGEEPFTMSD